MARSIWAEIQRQATAAAQAKARLERERARAEREEERARIKAVREHEQASKAQQRAEQQAATANAATQKRLQKEAREKHVATKEAEVRERNLELARVYDEIDELLAATLAIDDYIDIDSLKSTAEHPPFPRTDLEQPIPPPDPIPDPPEPVYDPPPAPKGLSSLFGKKKHAGAIEAAKADHDRALADWKTDLARVELERKSAAEKHEQMAREQAGELETERTRYAEGCAARETEVAERNNALDELKANLAYGAADAIHEYVSIVLSNSVYPDHFMVEHEFTFDPTTAELQLRVSIPSPDQLPTVRVFKYKKASDEIVETALSQKACKDRYSSATHQVALRSLHEVIEADRRGIIGTIALEVGTNTIDPATGLKGFIPLVAVGAERKSFIEFDLANVTPSATLELLGAAVSKNPFGLVAVDASGVRKS